MHTSLRIRFAAVALLIVALPTLPAHAVNKDMVQLQTQVQQLQDAVARLQQSNDERMGVMKDLVQQTADAVNRMSVSVGSLEQKMASQHEASGAKSDQISGQVQSLNDSLDEIKARMAKLDSVLKNIQDQQQQTNSVLQNQPASGNNSPASASTPSNSPGPGQPLDPQGPVSTTRNNNPPPQSSNGPSPDEMYRGALGDYMAGKYPLAASEFADLIKQYPDDNLSGNAYFYLGEINNKAVKPSIAVKDYDHLIEHYPDNAKIPAAHLHKGETLLSMKQPDAGVRELRALIQRFPNSPESAQARSRLNGMGIPIVPRTPR